MTVKVHPHARERMQERGASENEVTKTVETGERFPAKFGRSGFRRNFVFDGVWRGKEYKTDRSIWHRTSHRLYCNYCRSKILLGGET